MKINSIYIEFDKLHIGLISYADVDIDLQREDGKSIIIRVPLSPNDIAKKDSYGRTVTDGIKNIDRKDCIPTIKKHIGEVVMNKLFEGEEQLENLGK